MPLIPYIVRICLNKRILEIEGKAGSANMREKALGNIRKPLGIFLLVLFIISLSAISVSAASSGKYGSDKSDSYVRGYKDGLRKGYNDGFKDGITGKDPRMSIMIYYGPDSGYRGGYFKGYKEGYEQGYTFGKKIYDTRFV